MTGADTAPGPGWQPAAALGEALPVRLLRAREAMMQFYRPLFRAAGLTERQWRVLRALHDAGHLEPSEIARQAFMHPPNVSRVLGELNKAGYLARRAVDGDQRRAQVSLTESGMAVCAAVGRAIDDRTDALRQVLDVADLAALGRLLDIVIELPDRYPGLASGRADP
ncbi:MAG: MarR family transcriptional regulator [Sneathiellaceae bacterium]